MKLPHNVVRDTLPSGAIRYRVRIRISGKPKYKTLKVRPHEPGFNAAVSAALEYLETTDRAAADKAKADAVVPTEKTVDWLVHHYLKHLEVKVRSGNMEESSRIISDRYLSAFKNHIEVTDDYPDGLRLGDAYYCISRSAVARFRQTMIDRPSAADNARKKITAMYNWARDLFPDLENHPNPAERMARLAPDSDGHLNWEEAHIKTFLDYWAPGTLPRLAFLCTFHLASRRADLVGFSDSNLVKKLNTETRREAVYVSWEQDKGDGDLVEILLPDELAHELSLHPDGDTWLGKGPNREARSIKAFGATFVRWARAAGLPKGYTLHGIRKGKATMAAELGASQEQIGAQLGHKPGSAATAIYIRKANRKRQAAAVVDLLPSAATFQDESFPQGTVAHRGGPTPSADKKTS